MRVPRIPRPPTKTELDPFALAHGTQSIEDGARAVSTELGFVVFSLVETGETRRVRIQVEGVPR